MVRTACIKTVDEAGDSTTTTALLVSEICTGAHAEIQRGSSIRDLDELFEYDMQKIDEYLTQKSREVKNTSDIHNIAMVSSSNDSEIADTIRDVYEEAGMDVVIDVVETDEPETSFEVVRGYTMPDTGYTHNIFVNNHDRGRTEFVNPRVYVTNSRIRRITPQIAGLFEKNIDRNHPCLLYTSDAADE